MALRLRTAIARSAQSRPLAMLTRSLHSSIPRAQDPTTTDSIKTTHFGFETIPESEKDERGEHLPRNMRTTADSMTVRDVFSSVAASYDTMNDLMSLGIHRIWKDEFVGTLKPGSYDAAEGWNILDIAGGTGDIAFRMLDYATNIKNDLKTRVTVSDINPEMLAEGKKRSLQTPYGGTDRLSFLEANAEKLEAIPSNSIDLYTVAFGVRNFTNKQKALEEAFRVLKPGGAFACLEFSRVENSLFNAIYKRWSFSMIPIMGQLVAADRDSYQYLVESIEKFPSQEEFKSMIELAGFIVPGQGYTNLTGGIAAIHRGIKPLQNGP